jgi:hypothetical protein
MARVDEDADLRYVLRGRITFKIEDGDNMRKVGEEHNCLGNGTTQMNCDHEAFIAGSGYLKR